METSSSVLVDKSMYAKKISSSVPGFNGGGVGNNVVLLGSASQRHLSLHGAGVGGWPLGPNLPPYAPYPAPVPTYFSLPNPYILQHPYPPLLPLPMSKFLSLPSPSPLPSSGRMTGAATVHSGIKAQKKPRSSPSNSKKDLQRSVTRPQKVPPVARVPKSPATAVAPLCEDEKPEEEDGAFTNGVYVLSPPPSSLPIPKFFLRPRAPSGPPAASCNAEALGGGGPADARASDVLRCLLRL